MRLLAIATGLFALSLGFNLGWLVLAGPGWWALPAALFGWYVADALSGIIHFYLDYRPCTPGVGLDRLFAYGGSRGSAEYQQLRAATMARISPFERVVFDFKCHHPRPNVLGRRSFLSLVGNTVLFAALPLSLLVNGLCLLLPPPGWALAFMVTVLIGGTLSNYAHGCLHRERNPWFVAPLRRVRLLMTPRAHGVHHATLDRDFSTLNGWSNPLVNVLFRVLRRSGRLDPAGLEPA